MFGRAVFEVIEVKGSRMVKEQDFEAEKKIQNPNKCKTIQISNFTFMSYGHFLARNGSKSTIKTQKSEKSTRH